MAKSRSGPAAFILHFTLAMRWGVGLVFALAACSESTPQPEPGTDGSPVADAGTPSASVPSCSTEIAGELERLNVPGLAAGIIANGRLVCVSVAGQADIEAGQPVAPDSVFAWASVSKTVTATAAMILHDQGAFELDDDIDDYLPFSARNPNCPNQPISFRQLMTHTSSIVDNDQVYSQSYVIGDSPVPLGDFLRGYLEPGGDDYDPDDNFAGDCPGQVNDYSNVAAGLLGYLVEEIAGMPFDQFCQERIFAPLGMQETSFRLADLDLARVAMPYDRRPDGFEAHGHNGFPTYPDGLLRTSVPDMARFLAMFAGLGELDGQHLLDEATAAEMRRIQIPALDDTQALMWFYDRYGDRAELLGHDGDDPGTSALMFFDPADGAGALLVANGVWNQGRADALFGILFDEAAYRAR